MGDGREHLANYFNRFETAPPQIEEPPANNLSFIITIPCYDEPNLLKPLQSVWECDRPSCPVEVIIHINAAESAPKRAKEQNQQSYQGAREWIESHQDENLRYYLLWNDDLPDSDAGPGLARKIPMDEALHRFHNLSRPEGIIACLDADCKVAPNYLTEILRFYRHNPQTPAANIYFEHPIGHMSNNSEVRQGMTYYELFLRYFRNGLRYTGHPYAYHTIGSTMTVKAVTYAKQGGMNKNKGGEDLFFLQKIFPLGGFGEITNTTVYPEARASGRVPYGTGRAVEEWLEKGDPGFPTYPFRGFLFLKRFLRELPYFYALEGTETESAFPYLDHPLREFLKKQPFSEKIKEMKTHTQSLGTFYQRFFYWFDQMMVIKFLRELQDQGEYEFQITKEAPKLYKNLCQQELISEDPWEQLQAFRAMDRGKTKM